MQFSVILSTAIRYMLPLMLIFSIFILLRGHHEPGGGFIGGLVAAAAFALYSFTNSLTEVRQALRVEPRTLIGVGLLVAVSSASLSLFKGLPFMTGLWYSETLPVLGKIGTPVIFDMGVYIVVVGVTLLIIFSLIEEG
ncbi:MAG: Na+/H+ antiporter subunit B [Anaerolineae bacterium]|nr:Na+/H+ antiporter subunit B [Anaerolineae bacterium]MCB0178146.1 Na+/H+ antiporter subunit B [Anaerolineae bacterium]MCB9102896.1 Na+/H+ antiporter subunit B [Anaerolineales bacterium]